MESVKTLQGIVQKGQNRGKKLGFPTINFPLTESVDEGIYLSHILIGGKQYNALTFIGVAKTFNETKSQIEAYVLDFSEDIYGQKVVITLIKKLRDNLKFNSQEDLIKQMHEDKKQAEEFFKE